MFNLFWMPAFASLTTARLFYTSIKIDKLPPL